MKVHKLPGELRTMTAVMSPPAAPATPTGKPEKPPHPATTLDAGRYRLDRLTAGKPRPQRFTLAPLFPLGTLAVLFGPGGVGKSMTALELCMAVAWRGMRKNGGNLDFAAGPLAGNVPAGSGGATVFITLEDGQADVHRRRASLDPDMLCADAPVYVIPAIDIPGFDPVLILPAGGGRVALGAFAAALVVLLDRVQADAGMPVRLLMLDPAGDFLDGDESNAQFVKPLMRLLRELAARRCCTIILVGHVPKGAIDDKDVPTMRGSSAWIANARAAYAMWQPSVDVAASWAKVAGCEPEKIIRGCLVKANHEHAPTGRIRHFRRDESGRLFDISASAADVREEAKRAAEEGKEATRAAVAEMVACAMQTDLMAMVDAVPTVMDALHVKQAKARDLINEAVPEAPGGREVEIDGLRMRLSRVRTNAFQSNSPVNLVRVVIDD